MKLERVCTVLAQIVKWGLIKQRTYKLSARKKTKTKCFVGISDNIRYKCPFINVRVTRGKTNFCDKADDQPDLQMTCSRRI